MSPREMPPTLAFERLPVIAPERLPARLRQPILGVPFLVFLTVEAARLDGIADGAVLAWLGVGEAAFARVEEAWAERLDEALAGGPAPADGVGEPFDEVYEDLLGQALARWARPVPPLDRDVESWIAYLRHAQLADDPGELARKLGLSPGDEVRLARLWRARTGAPDIAARAQSAMDGPLGPLPRLSLSPLVFPPAKETP